MASKTAFFNKFLCASPEYTNVKDYNNVIKHIIVLKLPNTHIKVKFAKYKLMENKAPFYKAQRLFFVLHKFVQRCKAKYIKEYNNNLDLYGNPLHQKPMVLIENKTAYKFSLTDLQKIIINALLNQKHIIPEPLQPRNPYTNLPLSKHNLLIIYCLTLKKHPLFNIFYKCDFNISTFKENNRRILLEYAVDTYTSEYNEDQIDDIYYICENHNIRVSEDFPKNVLYNIFRPYLKEFYKIQYMFYSSKTLHFWLDCFELYNPYFGMKYTDSNSINYFDTRHLEFNQITAIEHSHNLKYAIKNKYKNNELCITLNPIKNAKYIIEHDEEDEEDDDNENYDE
jgi:hypothetical protein